MKANHNQRSIMQHIHVDERYELLNIHYYDHLHKSYHISWSDITDKSRFVLLETQIKVAELPQVNSVNDNTSNMFNETMPSKNLMHYVITFYHTASTLLIQGSQRTVWVEKEFPLLKAVLNHHINHCTTNINEEHNQILEIPEEYQLEQQRTGKLATPSTRINTSIIPENETKENTNTTQPQTKNTPSNETLANPTIMMITPPSADIALTIPTIIVTPPDTAETIELCSSNSPDVQNPFTMKHTTDQMLSQNSSKITMIEMVELTS